jgi:acyl CoA:acetate/3-ketoacid CoA transferase alpha subunit
MKKKRGRKPGQLNKWCKLPTCSRCSIRLHNGNAYKKANGQFTTYCRTCNTDVAIIKAWRNKGFGAIQDRIIHYEHMIELLLEATDQLKERRSIK